MAIRRKRHISILLVIFLLYCHAVSHAFDGASYDLLSGNQKKIGRLGLQWHWQSQWFKGDAPQPGDYRDSSAAYWRDSQNQHIPGTILSFTDPGGTAVFRFQRNDGTGFYAEAGAGPRYLPDLYDSHGRRQASRFILNSHAGVGFIWKNGIDLGFKAMHISNSSTMSDNDVVNAVGVGLRYRW